MYQQYFSFCRNKQFITKELLTHHCALCYQGVLYTHFSPSSAGVLADAAISSPGSWPFPLGIAFPSAGAVSSAGLGSLIAAQVPQSVCMLKCLMRCLGSPIG